jgi:hypothetical protein
MGACLSIAMVYGCDLIVGIVTVEPGPSSGSSVASGTGGGGVGGGAGGSGAGGSGAGGSGSSSSGAGGYGGAGGSGGAGGVITSEHVWSGRFGGIGRQTVVSIDIDPSGDIILAGSFDGVLGFDPEPALSAPEATEIFVAKLDSSGAEIGKAFWSKKSSTPMGGVDASIMDAAVDPISGEIIVLGSFSQGTSLFGCSSGPTVGGSDVGIVKLDATGGCMWYKAFGSTGNDSGTSVAVDSAQNIYITGHFSGVTDYYGEPIPHVDGLDVFVLKLNSSGDLMASATLGGSGNQTLPSIAVHGATGAVFVTGACEGIVDPMDALTMCDGKSDVFVAKLSMSDLAKSWIKRFGDSELQQPRGIATTADGGIVITGHFVSALQFDMAPPLTSAGVKSGFIAKLSSQGSHVWSLGFGDGPPREGRGVAVDSAGNVPLIGMFTGNVDLGCGVLQGIATDILWAKLEPDGKCKWSGSAGDGDLQKGLVVAVDSRDSVFIAGEMQGTADFGGGPLSAQASDLGDIFIAKFAP